MAYFAACKKMVPSTPLDSDAETNLENVLILKEVTAHLNLSSKNICALVSTEALPAFKVFGQQRTRCPELGSQIDGLPREEGLYGES